MIGLIFFYWIWKSYANLAEQYDKNKWLYFFIGIVSYYGGTIVAGFVLGICSFILTDIQVVDGNSMNPAWNLLFILCGGLTCYGVYKLLEYKGEKEIASRKKDGIDSIGVTDEE